MSAFKKLVIKNIDRKNILTMTEIRRNKLVASVDLQSALLDAELRGQKFSVTKLKWTKSENGERVSQTVERKIKPWYFQNNDHIVVQAKYGVKILTLSKDGNSVQVSKRSEVQGVLAAIKEAAITGELDTALEAATHRSNRKSKMVKAA